MVLRYNVVNFKNLNLKGFTKFCSKYGYKAAMSVKMDSTGVGVKIYDKNKKIGISTSFAKDLSKVKKDLFLEENCSDEEILVYKIYAQCDYEFSICVKNSEEYNLAYIFAIYIAYNTDIILTNYDTKVIMITEELKNISEEELEKLVEQYKIRSKYIPEIDKLRKNSGKLFNYSKLFWIILIILSLVGTVLFILMLLVYNVDNNLILSLPFILIGILYCCIFIKDFCVSVKTQSKIKELVFKYEKEICLLYNDRIPKEPSKKKKNIKQVIINIMGILIVPGMIGGSILLAFNKFILGFISILLPWIVLVGIKMFITDIEEKKIKDKLYLWLDNYFKETLTEELVALNFDLSEEKNNNWSIEIVGCYDFSLDNSMWSKNAISDYRYEKFSFKMNCTWEDVQILLSNMILEYFSFEKKKRLLEKFKAISIGFNDGAIRVIYLNKNMDKE